MLTPPMSDVARPYWSAHRQVPGWFDPDDFLLFDWILTDQVEAGVTGDLLEIGAFLGRSAVLLGLHARAGEAVDICDLWEQGATGPAGGSYAGTSYSGLSRNVFETNYRTHVSTPARIHQRPSAELAGLLTPGYRFIHLDGSHVFDYVRRDVDTAVALLGESGVVAVDDYRNAHFPGVAAAVWAAVAAGRLQPICVTPAKLYATAGDVAAMQARMRSWLERHPVLEVAAQDVAGGDVLCVSRRRPTSMHDVVRDWTPPAAKQLLRRDRIWRGRAVKG